MRSFSWVMVLLAGSATAGPAPREIEPNVAVMRATPDIPAPFAKAQAILDALRMNDFRALLEAKMSPGDVAHMEDQWTSAQENFAKKEAEAKSDPAFIEVQAVWMKLQTPAGVDALVAEWQPKLASEAKSQITQFNLGLAMALTAIADDRELTIPQSMMMRDLVLAVQKWANDTDFDDPQRLRRAIDAFAVEVRRSGFESPLELLALPLEQALAYGDAALRAAKQALAAYDLHVDATLDSIRITQLERDGENAKVRFEARVLGVNLAHDQEMRWYEDNWVDAKRVQQHEDWEREHAEFEAAKKERARIEREQAAKVRTPLSARPCGRAWPPTPRADPCPLVPPAGGRARAV